MRDILVKTEVAPHILITDLTERSVQTVILIHKQTHDGQWSIAARQIIGK